MTEIMGTIVIRDAYLLETAECPHFCSPSVHPAQTGPEWKYGCRSEKHPRHDPFDFVAIVKCEGKLSKCEIDDA